MANPGEILPPPAPHQHLITGKRAPDSDSVASHLKFMAWELQDVALPALKSACSLLV